MVRLSSEELLFQAASALLRSCFSNASWLLNQMELFFRMRVLRFGAIKSADCNRALFMASSVSSAVWCGWIVFIFFLNVVLKSSEWSFFWHLVQCIVTGFDVFVKGEILEIVNLIAWWSVHGNGSFSKMFIFRFCLKIRSSVWPEVCVGPHTNCCSPNPSRWSKQASATGSCEELAQRLKSPSSKRSLLLRV